MATRHATDIIAGERFGVVAAIGTLAGALVAMDLLARRAAGPLGLSSLAAPLALGAAIGAVALVALRVGVRALVWWVAPDALRSGSRYQRLEASSYAVFLLPLAGVAGFHVSVPMAWAILLAFAVGQAVLALRAVSRGSDPAGDPGARAVSRAFHAESSVPDAYLALLFALSGMAALVYEIVWQRVLYQAYGINIESVTLIVSVFMLGLGLGALAGGWASERFPLWLPELFAGAELAIGAFGAVSIPLIEAIAARTLHLSTAGVAAAVFASVLLPTLLMGATLPILVAHVTRHDPNVGASVGRLYGLNTLGAALASLLTVDVLFVMLGRQAAVWVAVLLNLTVGKRVALKRLDPELGREPALAAAFLAEARVAARVGHPNIADILDVGIDRDGLPYIVMELIEGETLQQVLARRGPLPVPYACELMLQVLAAVDAAHATGIVHRDLKPANVIVSHPHPDQPRVKVLDFGIAQGLVEAEGQQVASVRWAGTPLYMAPEQALDIEVDHRADVYSASVMLYELLTGEFPYPASTIEELFVKSLSGTLVPMRERVPSLPKELTDVIEAGLSGRREKRLGSVRELADGLAPFVAPPRRASFRESGVLSGSPIPLVDKKHLDQVSWQVIGFANSLSERALCNPKIPSPPATPRIECEPLPDQPQEEIRIPMRSNWRAVVALAIGFALGLGATFAYGLLP